MRGSLKRAAFFAALCLCGLSAWAQSDSVFYVKGGKGRLAVRLQLPSLRPGEKCHIAVLCHGFMGDMDGQPLQAVADSLLRKGIGVFRFDFNGHGKSEGDFVAMTVPGEIEDALAVVAFVRRLPQAGGVSLLGYSQGGVVAAMAAGQLGKEVVERLVLLAPAAVLRDDALRGNTFGAVYDPWHAPEYVTLPGGRRLGRDFIQTAISLPIYETAARYAGPTLVLHGMADRVVPYTYGERFAQVMPGGRVELIPGTDHAFSACLPWVAAKVSGWLVGEQEDGADGAGPGRP